MDFFRPPGVIDSLQACGYPDGLFEDRQLQPIRKIVLKDGVNVVFRCADEAKLVIVSGVPEGIASVETKFIHETLVIQRDHSCVVEDCPSCPAQTGVVIALPIAPQIKVKGRAGCTLFDLDQDDLDIQVNGAGYVNAYGQVDRLDVWVYGAGVVHVRELVADEAMLSVSSSGHIAAHVRSKVTARVMGMGNILIGGHPAKRDRTVEGYGHIDFI